MSFVQRKVFEMASTIKIENIKSEAILIDKQSRREKSMLPGEIEGVSVINYTLPRQQELIFENSKKHISIFFLLDGEACFVADGNHYEYAEKAVFAALPQTTVCVHAISDCSFLKINWDMNEYDFADLENNKESFPYTKAYNDSQQYRDFFKSEKTVSRAIIPQAIIPRFAMGSVETSADDLIGQHAHPLLDQFFFSFPENDMYLLIDSCIFPMKGSTLVHIPLGSNHGVIALNSQRVHYLWLDFTPQELKDDAVAYLDEIHVAT